MTWDKSLGGLLAINIIMVALGVVTTALRFWSRAVIFKGHFGLDDWLCLGAMFPIIALGCTGMYMIHHGLKPPMADINMPQALHAHVFKGFFVSCIFFTLGLGLTKLSTLAFYRRIFGNLRQHDLLSWTIPFYVALIVTTVWTVLAIFLAIFRCDPVSRAWDLKQTGTCISSVSTYLLISGAVNLFEDAILIVLPIPRILSLALPPRKKALVTTLLIFGASIPLICIGRIVTIVVLATDLDNGFSEFIVPIAFWLIAEPSISVLAISIPALFQLVQHGGKHGFRSLSTDRGDGLYARKDFFQRSGGSSYPTHLSPPIDLVCNNVGQVSSSVRVETGTASKPLSSPSSNDGLLRDANAPVAPEVIHVKREFNIRYGESTSGSDN